MFVGRDSATAGRLVDEQQQIAWRVGHRSFVLWFDAHQAHDAVRHPIQQADDGSNDPGEHAERSRKEQ